MIEFQYRINGRTPGVAEITRYTGHIIAQTPKDGLLAALVAEFGHKSDKPLINQLCDDGWVDHETVTDHLHGLPDGATHFCLDTGDLTFDVEVDEVEGNPPHDYVDGAGDA